MKNNLVLSIKQALENKDNEVKILDFFGGDVKKIIRFKSALLNIASNQALQGCTQASILKSAFSIAELNLELNPALAHAYILKYKLDAEPVISYKGWQVLLERSGKKVRAFSVFKCDNFTIKINSKDFDEDISFIPNLSERKSSDDNWYKNNLLGVLVKIKDGEDIRNYFIQVDKIEKIRGKSPSQKSDFSPYNQWAEEMYLAKAIKYVLSRTPLNINEELIAKAIEIDNNLDKQLQDDNRGVKKEYFDFKEDKEDKIEELIEEDNEESLF